MALIHMVQNRVLPSPAKVEGGIKTRSMWEEVQKSGIHVLGMWNTLQLARFNHNAI